MNKFIFQGLIIFIIFVCIFFALYFLMSNSNNHSVTDIKPILENINDQKVDNNPISTNKTGLLTLPIENALTRITKKPFGLKVSPTNSPVSPERFSGYHTGVDFETFIDEQNIDVPIYATCSGPLILKKIATGYGGVAVQQCRVNESDVTVIYGHLKLSSINANLNNQLKAGVQIGILGNGYSNETDGERKHLHLSIHGGKEINLRGYVQKEVELDNWLNPAKLFPK